MSEIMVKNNGPEIVETNYWESELDRKSKLFVSVNARAFRILLPRNLMEEVAEMRTAKEVFISRGPWPEQGQSDAVEFLFEDGSPNPYAIHFTPNSFDRPPTKADMGKCLVSVWVYSPNGPLKALELPAQLQNVSRLPWMGENPSLQQSTQTTSPISAPSRLKLKNGTILECQPILSNHFIAQRQGTVYLFAADGLEIRLRANNREAKTLAHSAQLAGAHLHSASLPLLTLLAFAAANEVLPTPNQLDQIKMVLSQVERTRPTELLLSDKEIHSLVRRSIHEAGKHLTPPELPPGNWNAARYLMFLGQHLWQINKETAYLLGTLPVVQTIAEFQAAEKGRVLFLGLAGLGFRPEWLSNFPIVPKPNVPGAFIYTDWISLIWGPNQPPVELRPLGLGDAGDSPLETNIDPFQFGLTSELAESLVQIAATLLERVERPVPHYHGRMFDVPVPQELLPQFAVLQIVALRIQVESTGLWVAALDQTKRSLAASFWKAASDTYQRAPLCFSLSSWCLVHATCAALWHDLCREAVRIEQSTDSHSPAGHNRANPRGVRGQEVALPIRGMVSRVPSSAVWSSVDELETILNSIRNLGRDYRRLPPGWEKRRDKVDFEQRRHRAAERAVDFGCAPPPPGFTFVRPFTRKRLSGADRSEPRIVRSQGLFALALTLSSRSEKNDEDKVDYPN